MEADRPGARPALLDHGRQGQRQLLPDQRTSVNRVQYGHSPRHPQQITRRLQAAVRNGGGHLGQRAGCAPRAHAAHCCSGHCVCPHAGEKGDGTGAGSQMRAHSDARVHAGWLRDGPVAVQAWKGEGQRLGERLPKGARAVLHKPTRSGAGNGAHQVQEPRGMAPRRLAAHAARQSRCAEGRRCAPGVQVRVCMCQGGKGVHSQAAGRHFRLNHAGAGDSAAGQAHSEHKENRKCRVQTIICGGIQDGDSKCVLQCNNSGNKCNASSKKNRNPVQPHKFKFRRCDQRGNCDIGVSVEAHVHEPRANSRWRVQDFAGTAARNARLQVHRGRSVAVRPQQTGAQDGRAR